jgi:hypothetical protein
MLEDAADGLGVFDAGKGHSRRIKGNDTYIRRSLAFQNDMTRVFQATSSRPQVIGLGGNRVYGLVLTGNQDNHKQQ